MKKSLLLIAFLLTGFFGISQNKMPYYIMYQMDGDTVYRSLQSISSIDINSERQRVSHNSGTDLIPLSGLDTVTVFRDKFRKYVGEMADWDEVLFSMEQIHFYKENANGQPAALFSFYVNDSIPDGYFVYSEFDDEGNLEFTNMNDSCVMMVSEVNGDRFNAVVINSDMSSFSIDGVAIQTGYDLRAWDDLTPAQRANVTMKSYLGGLNMAMGGATMLLGCAMLVPGANIAIGATIALAGAASFISGAFMATRATDQIISDGTHTEGFDEASNVFGVAGTVLGAVASGSVASAAANIAFDAFTNGVDATGDLLVERESEAIQAAKERARHIMNTELSTTGRAELVDLDDHSVRLYGNITAKLDPNDRFGIMICKDQQALTVENCQLLETSHPIGTFHCDFSGLEPCEGYYYRTYYYSNELAGLGFNPEVVSTSPKSFWMPGCITLYPDFVSGYSYTLNGKFQNVANLPSHTVGFCYSSTNQEPTIDDVVIEQTISECGEFSAQFTLQTDFVYYRAYGYVDGQVIYGETRMITNERYMLEKLYADTHGENWIHNDNWCTGEDVRNWYGVRVNSQGHVISISLDNNNLNGDIEIVGMNYLEAILVNGNQINSIFIGSCPNYNRYNTDFDGITLRKLHFDNCSIYRTLDIDNSTIDTIIFTNLNLQDDFHIDFFNVESNKIEFDNCQFGENIFTVDIDGYSRVDLLYMNNCSITYGGISSDENLTHLYISNSTMPAIFFGSYSDIQYITLFNATVEYHLNVLGDRTVHVSYLSGPSYYVWNAALCMAYPESCDK